jgi:drug/metabolite transporter (DMT)-like permease
MMMKYAMLFGSVTMTVVASTLLKIGGRGINFEGGFSGILLGYATSPVIIAGFATYAVAAILWVYCLAQFDLSYVTFVSSIQYVLLVIVSIFAFQEQISLMKWIGCAFIMVGVVCWLKG